MGGGYIDHGWEFHIYAAGMHFYCKTDIATAASAPHRSARTSQITILTDNGLAIALFCNPISLYKLHLNSKSVDRF